MGNYKQQKVSFRLPEYSDDDINTAAEEILHYLVERTKAGKGVDGKPFKGDYSKAYRDSLEFKVAGKSGLINLTLSGEMLDSLEILKAGNGKVEIGYSKDSDMNGRAEGNILGSYGGKPNKKRARNFLEISDKEIKKIVKKLDIIPRDIQKEISDSSNYNANELLSNFNFDVQESED